MLMAVEESPGFESAARRWLVRFIREERPMVNEVKRVADALTECGEDYLLPRGEGPRAALRALAE
jgi:hypothetical protein